MDIFDVNGDGRADVVGSGAGLHFGIIDLDGDGLLDIVTSNKKGACLFRQDKR